MNDFNLKLKALTIRIAEELYEQEHITKTEWEVNKSFIILTIFAELLEFVDSLEKLEKKKGEKNGQ